MKKLSFLSFLLLLAACNSVGTKSPYIEKIQWGEITIREPNGKKRVYKDCKLFPGTAIEWDWGKTGTRHHPGIQIADIEEFINNVDYVILSKGMDEILQTTPETIQYLEGLKKQEKIKNYYILQTQKSVEKYNELAQKGEKVGGVFHSTC